MKVILATAVFPPEISGHAAYIKNLAEQLRDTHIVTIVAYASTSENVSGTKLRTLSKRHSLPLRLLKATYVLFTAAKGADVLYVQNSTAMGLPALIVKYIRNIPLVIHFSGDEAWERATQLHLTEKSLGAYLRSPEGTLRIRLIMWLQGFILRHADTVAIPSLHLQKALVHAYHLTLLRTCVIYTAAEKPQSIHLPVVPEAHQIITSAWLVPWKGIDGVIRATQKLVAAFPDVRLLIAGDGPEKKNLQTVVADLNLSDHVTFLGRVSRAETWHLRKTSGVYVLNSTHESLPHTVLTSFAAEIPVVATRIPGTTEAVIDGESGLLVEPKSAVELAAAITKIFLEPQLRTHLVQGGKKILAETFSWPAHTRAVTILLASVHAKNCEGRRNRIQ